MINSRRQKEAALCKHYLKSIPVSLIKSLNLFSTLTENLAD